MLIGDHSATTTLGTEFGLGYGPNVAPGLNACTVDLGAPISLAMLKRVRLVSFVTPGVGLDIDCSPGGHPVRREPPHGPRHRRAAARAS